MFYPGPIDPGLFVTAKRLPRRQTKGPMDLVRDLLRPEVETLLDDIISVAEGGAYDRRYGGSQFNLYGGHPGFIPRGVDKNGDPIGEPHSPAGFVQMTEGTWNDVADRYGLDKSNFGAFNQRLGATARLLDRNALEPLLRGDLDSVITLLKPEWAALPDVQKGGGRMSMEEIRQRFADGMARRAP